MITRWACLPSLAKWLKGQRIRALHAHGRGPRVDAVKGSEDFVIIVGAHSIAYIIHIFSYICDNLYLHRAPLGPFT